MENYTREQLIMLADARVASAMRYGADMLSSRALALFDAAALYDRAHALKETAR